VTKEAPPYAPSASPAPKAFAEAGITHNDVDHLMI
jgi:transposase